MAALQELDLDRFMALLRPATAVSLASEAWDALYAHYVELQRWAPKVALIGPGAVEELFERHYAESLAVEPLLPKGRAVALDVGSGAGFPGIMIAILRPGIELTLTESRERKWAFLQAACRRARLSSVCLNVRVAPQSAAQLPEKISLISSRAVQFDGPTWEAITPRLTSGAQALFWCGERVAGLPAEFEEGRIVRLSGERRWIREFLWRGSR